jgi:c-di-GMP-related signal transduction protein
MANPSSSSVEEPSKDLGKLPAEATKHVIAPDGLRYVARQPILDVRGNVHGYELLFRSGPAAGGFSGDGDAATRTVLDNTVIFGLERLTGNLPAFVNCTQEALLNRLVMVLPASQTVLELLETLDPTPALLEACRELKERGFRLALDDFEWKPEWRAFAALADYVKVDLSKTSPEQRARLMRNLRGGSAQLVAERVETQADLEMAHREGFGLFQGYYFCRPVLMENRSIPANRLVHLEMLQALHEDPLDTARVSSLVKLDASLTYRLLRMVNSPMYGMGKEIRSIHGALVMVGDEMFRRVAMLAIASELKGNHSSELLRMAFSRGRFCELAASMTGQNRTEQYLLGVLSLLPAMMRIPMESIAKALPLRKEVRCALLGESNAERWMLDWLISIEMGQWERCDEISLRAGLPDADLPKLYAEALLWAETNMSLAMK